MSLKSAVWGFAVTDDMFTCTWLNNLDAQTQFGQDSERFEHWRMVIEYINYKRRYSTRNICT